VDVCKAISNDSPRCHRRAYEVVGSFIKEQGRYERRRPHSTQNRQSEVTSMPLLTHVQETHLSLTEQYRTYSSTRCNARSLSHCCGEDGGAGCRWGCKRQSQRGHSLQTQRSSTKTGADTLHIDCNQQTKFGRLAVEITGVGRERVQARTERQRCCAPGHPTATTTAGALRHCQTEEAFVAIVQESRGRPT
jgi:hypothetical protein